MRIPQFFLVAFLILLPAILAQDTTNMTSSTAASSASEELPITTTYVFIQSGEATETTINIMARCNNEEESTMSLMVSDNVGGEEITQEADVTSDTDFTHTFVVDGLSPDTYYTYLVECIPNGEGLSVYGSVEGIFKTIPAADAVKAVSFVWVSCLSGQGYGRNPDFEITNTDGEIVKGEIDLVI